MDASLESTGTGLAFGKAGTARTKAFGGQPLHWVPSRFYLFWGRGTAVTFPGAAGTSGVSIRIFGAGRPARPPRWEGVLGEFLRLGRPFPLTRLVLVVLGFISCVHPRWFNPPLHTNASFLHFFTFFFPRGNFGVRSRCFGGRGNFGRFYVLFWHPAGTTGEELLSLGLYPIGLHGYLATTKRQCISSGIS